MVPCDICCGCQHLPRQRSGWGSCQVYWPECPSASEVNSVSRLPHCLRTLPAMRYDKCWVKHAEQIWLCYHSSCGTTERTWILVTRPKSGSATLNDQRIMVQFPVETGIFLLLFSAAYRMALGSTQHLIQWVPEALSLGGKAAGVWNWPLMSLSPQGKERSELRLCGTETIYLYFISTWCFQYSDIHVQLVGINLGTTSYRAVSVRVHTELRKLPATNTMYRTSWSGLFVIRSATGMTGLFQSYIRGLHVTSTCFSLRNEEYPYINLTLQPAKCWGQKWRPQLRNWWCDDALPGQGYYIRQKAVICDYAAIAKLWLVGAHWRNLERNLFQNHFIHHKSHMKSFGIEPAD